MRPRIIDVMFVAGLFLTASPVRAAQGQQTTASTDAERQSLARSIVLRGIVLPGITDPLLKSAVSSPKPEIILVVQNDGSTSARARIGFIHNSFLGDVTVTGPVSGGALVSPDGIATGASVRVRAQWVKWTLTSPADVARSITGVNAITAATAERQSESILRSGVDISQPFFISGAFEFGSQAFKFIDASTLADAEVTKAAQAGNVSVGMLVGGASRSAGSPGVYFGGGVEIYRRFKATAERTICRPIGTGGFECDKFRVGAPSEKTGQSAEFESRLWVGSGNIGLNPKIGYDLKDRDWNLEMPVYFLKLVADAEKPLFSGIPDLAGGVSVGWKSGTNGGPYVLLFIGPTFKLPSPK